MLVFGIGWKLIKVTHWLSASLIFIEMWWNTSCQYKYLMRTDTRSYEMIMIECRYQFRQGKIDNLHVMVILVPNSNGENYVTSTLPRLFEKLILGLQKILWTFKIRKKICKLSSEKKFEI